MAAANKGRGEPCRLKRKEPPPCFAGWELPRTRSAGGTARGAAKADPCSSPPRAFARTERGRRQARASRRRFRREARTACRRAAVYPALRPTRRRAARRHRRLSIETRSPRLAAGTGTAAGSRSSVKRKAGGFCGRAALFGSEPAGVLRRGSPRNLRPGAIAAPGQAAQGSARGARSLRGALPQRPPFSGKQHKASAAICTV